MNINSIAIAAVPLVLIISCAPQHRWMHKSKEQSHYQIQEQQFYRFEDSLSRQWYFYTDSLLLFRPDSGLISKSGRIWMNERRESQVEAKQRLGVKSHFQTEENQKKRDTGKYAVYVLLGIVLLLGVVKWLGKVK